MNSFFFLKKLFKGVFFLFSITVVIYLLNLYFANYSDYIYEYNVVFGYSIYIIFFIGFILSFLFNKSRTFFILLLIFLIQIISNDLLNNILSEWITFPVKYFVFIPRDIVILLMSFNLIIFSFYRERGIFTIWGLKRFLFVLLQTYGCYLLISNDLWYKRFMEYLDINFITFKLPVDKFSDFFILLILVTFIVLLIRLKKVEKYALLFILINLIIPVLFLDVKEEVHMLLFSSLSAIVLIFNIIKNFYSMAYIDELTGLPSRRALSEELNKLGSNYSVAMLDIDFFKKFNDKYGHDTGDQALKMVSALIKKTRGGAKAFRYGGEEFTLIFSGKSVKEVYPYLEKLVKLIANRPFVIRGRNRPKRKSKKKLKSRLLSGSKKEVKVTVSIGVAEKGDKHNSPDEVIKDADKALYKAKKTGRNRVCI